MPVPPNAGRRSFFKHGEMPFATSANVFIYGSNSLPTQSRHSDMTLAAGNLDKYGLSADNQFRYGTNENTPTIVDKSYNKRSNFPLDVKTSREIRKKALQAQEAREDYANFLDRKQNKLVEREHEKRKDYQELSSYMPPWCMKSNSPLSSRLQMEEHRKYKRNEQEIPTSSSPTYIKIGQPGHGAPIRSDSGEIKTIRRYDPEVRFQKRNRYQVYDIIQPKEALNGTGNECNILGQEIKVSTNLTNAKKSSYDILGQPKSERRNWNNVDKGMTRNITRNALPRERYNDESRFLEKPHVKVPCNELPVLKPVLVRRAGLDVAGRKCSERFNPWGKAGNGAPIYDENGSLFTQLKHPKEDLVPFLKKTTIEKELQRKQLEAAREPKPDPAVDTELINNDNYYKMHLDAQRNKEALQNQPRGQLANQKATANRVENVIYNKAKRAITKPTETHQPKVEHRRQPDGKTSNNNNTKEFGPYPQTITKQSSEMTNSYTDTYKPSAVENLGTGVPSVPSTQNSNDRSPAREYNVLGQPFLTESTNHVKFSKNDEIFTNRPITKISKTRDDGTEHVEENTSNDAEVEVEKEVVVSSQPVFSVSVQKKLEERRKSIKPS